MLDSLFYNLTPSPLWSTSGSRTLHFILHTFLRSVIIFFAQHTPIPLQPVLLQYFDCLLFLVSLYVFTWWHIHLIIFISACRSVTHLISIPYIQPLPCNILWCTQLLYSLSLIINDISLLVSNRTKLPKFPTNLNSGFHSRISINMSPNSKTYAQLQICTGTNKKLCYGRGTTWHAHQYGKKLAIDEWPWHTPKVITVAAIKWPYGISHTSCLWTVVLMSLSRTVIKTLPLMKWTWLPVTLRTPSFLTTKLKLQATWNF